MLNLAFNSDPILEKLLEEQDKELEREELRRKGGKTEEEDTKVVVRNMREIRLQSKTQDWEKEYKNLREAFLETRFEYERIDMKLKEEIQLLSKKLNDFEDKYREKSKVPSIY